jgi:hypothetical protein
LSNLFDSSFRGSPGRRSIRRYRRKLRKFIFNKVLFYILFLNNRRESTTLIIW